MFVISKEISSFLNQLPLSKGPIVVGVSGGTDSLYLTYLLNEWAKQKRQTLLAVTVNHNLRPNSKEEAEWVHKTLQKQTISHTILSWDGIKPKTKIEEKAREKRYELLINFCHQHKAKFLFLAHHQQDQAETFWARLSRGSGLDGLCGIAPISKRAGITIVRPLLNTPKTVILKTLKQNRLKWAEDPMNQDLTYERVQWRKAQGQLDKLGLQSTNITKSEERLQRAKEALDFYTQDFLQNHLHKSPYGFVSMDEKSFLTLPQEIRIRALIQILNLFNKKNKIISLESVEKIIFNTPKYATLAGCQWVISHHQIFVAPELKSLSSINITPNTWTVWGGTQIFTNFSFLTQAAAPTPRKKNIPYLIQRTFLKTPEKAQIICINSEKELEKKAKMDYKDNKPFVVIQFNQQKDIK